MKQSTIAIAVGLAFAVYGEGTHALPEGGQVSAGQGTIGAPANGSLVIHQQSSRLAIDWLRFGIGTGESVHFAQPGASAIALNRVLGTDPSRIYGSLSATGQVFLLNPNGVLFAPGSQVNVGGLVASTLGLSNEDFLAGRYVFSKGEKAGAVVNQGDITAGYAALLGPQVSNEGIITATLGSVALAAGEQITLNLNGTSLVGLSVDKGALDAMAANKHLIRADGGTVILTARATDELLRNVVNNDGIIEARTISERNGAIRLESTGSGITSVSGSLNAKQIAVTGDKVGLFDGARLESQGGTILVGGNFQGKGPERNSSATYVAPGARLSADAIGDGDGGTVVVWSDGATRFYGHLSARGGPQGGDGGFAEISGKGSLVYRGTVDLTAPHGNPGQILFDPKNILISHTVTPDAVTTNDQFHERAGVDVTFDADSITAITNTGAAVIVQANNDITVSEVIVSDNPSGNGGALTFQAGRSILVNASITTDNGNLTLIANERAASLVDTANRDDGAAVITMAASTALNAGSGTMTIHMRDGAGRTGDKETSGDITLRQISAGTLNVIQAGTTAGSDIVQDGGVITVSGTSSFTSTGDITATGSNDFQGTVTVEGVRVQLTDSVGVLALAPASVSELTVNAQELHLSGTYSTSEGLPLALGRQNFNASLIRLTGDTTLTAPRDIEIFGGVVVGPGSLTINHTNAGSVSIGSFLGLAPSDPHPFGGGAIGASGPLGGLSVSTTDTFSFPGSSYVGGDVSVSASNSIQQSGSMTVTGTSSFTAGNDIQLTASNDFQDTVTVEGVRVQLTDSVGVLALAPASVSELTVNAQELHLSGTYSTSEGLPFALGRQNFNASLIRLTGDTTLTAPRDIEIFGGVVVGPGSLTINHTNAGSVSIGSFLGLAPSDPHPFGGGAIGASGPLGGLSVSTTDTFSFPGSSYVGGDVSVSASNSIQQSGSMTVTGTSSFTAGNDIQLTASNDFQDTVTVEGVRVQLTDSVGVLALAPASVSELTVNAQELHLSGTYSTSEGLPFALGRQNFNASLIRLTGDTTLTAPRDIEIFGGVVVGPGSLTINHTNAGSVSIGSFLGLAPSDPHPFGGGAIGASGPLGGLSVSTTDTFSFPGSSYVGGDVSVSASNSIQQSGSMTVTGTSSFTAGNDIQLTASNDFQDTVTVEGVRVQLTDSVGVLALAPASVSELTVNAQELHLSGTYSTSEGLPFALGRQNFNASLIRLTGDTTLTAPRDIEIFGGVVVGPGSLTINHTNAGSVSIGSFLGLAPSDPHPFGGGAIGASGPLGGLNIATTSSLSLPDVFASGTILADATGNLTLPVGTTLRSNSAGNAIALSTAGNFVNNAGSGALSAPFGRWLVYSTSPAGSTEGGLTALADATTPRLYNRSFGVNPPSSITEPGNHLVYSFAPTVTVTANAASRGYGAGNPVFTFTTGALVTDDGVTDSSAAFTGSLATTAVPASPVSSSPFAITQGSLVSGAGYGITYTPANLTITPAPLTITADNYTKAENNPNPIFTATFTGFVLGESSPNLQGALVFNTPATTTSAPGSYAITPSGNTSGNYAITYVDGSLTVTGVAPVVAPTASPPAAEVTAGVTVEVGQAYFEALAAVKAAERAAPPSAPQALGLPELYVIQNGGVRLPEGLQ